MTWNNPIPGEISEEKKGRMRPATCWRPEKWQRISAQHKDRSLILALQGEPNMAEGCESWEMTMNQLDVWWSL